MRTWRIVLAGFGTVGQGAAERLAAAAPELAARGIDPRIVAVLDPAHGSAVSEAGLEPATLLRTVATGSRLDALPGVTAVESTPAMIREVAADVLFEMTPTNLRDGEPGAANVRAALESGKHVATTNKGPVALFWNELQELAQANDVGIRCEGTVLSGTPVLNVCDRGLAGAGVRTVRGILNGTCNFILTRMEDGADYDAALAEAQALGYAETNPAGDVEGWDAAAKVTILGNLVLGGALALSDVSREGIAGVDPDEVRSAAAEGSPLRLVGAVSREAGALKSPRVALERVQAADPLASVDGAGNLVTFETDALGAVSIAGPGAGRDETGHALVADLIAIHETAGA